MTKNDGRLNLFDWARWSVATAVAAVSMTAGLIAWAEGKFVSQDVFAMLVNRLDRIESKLDTVLHFKD